MGLNNMSEPITSALGGQAIGTVVGVLGVSIYIPQIDGGLLIAAAFGSIVYTSLNVSSSNLSRLLYGLLSLIFGYIFGGTLASIVDAVIEYGLGREVEVSAEVGAVIASLLSVYFVRGLIHFGENPKACTAAILEFGLSAYHRIKRMLP